MKTTASRYNPAKPKRQGTLNLNVASYWAFKNAKLKGENDDDAIFRIVQESKMSKTALTFLFGVICVYTAILTYMWW